MGRIKTFKTYEEAEKHVLQYKQPNFAAMDELKDRYRRSEEKRREYPPSDDLGKGLEFVCGIYLIAIEANTPKDYTFYGDMFALFHQDNLKHFNYPTIESMAAWADKWLKECQEYALGGKVAPLVYTTSLTKKEMEEFEGHFFKE